MGREATVTVLMVVTALFFGLPNASPGQLADSPWPAFGIDLRNTNQSAYEGPEKDTIRWTHKFRDVVPTSAVVGPNGRLYIGNRNTLYAFNPDGTMAWQHSLGEKIHLHASSPTISSDSVLYFGSENSKLAAVSMKGKRLWTVDLTYELFSPPAIGADGTIYANTGWRLNAIAPAGTLKWSLDYQRRGCGRAPAIASDSSIVVGANNLLKISPEGEVLWTYDPGQYPNHWTCKGIATSPAIDSEGRIYTGTVAGTLHTLSSEGKLLWKYNAREYPFDRYATHGAIAKSPAIAGDSLVYVVSGVGPNVQPGHIHALYPDSGVKWKREIELLNPQQPAVDASGDIYVGTGTGIYALNPKGKIKWQVEAHNGGFSSPVISARNRLYIAGSDSTFKAVGGTPTSIPDEGGQLARQVSLEENYPNPFNPVTTITYRIPQTDRVQLNVYTLSGRKVTTLVEGLRQAGKHEVQFRAEDLASGLYLYRLRVGDDVSRERKMLLIK